MANIIMTKTDANAAFTITIASLTNGSARQSTLIDNTTLNRPSATVYVKITSGGSAPTVNTTYDVYLVKGNKAASATYYTDGGGASDAAITILNARCLGSIVLTASSATAFYGEFHTSPYGPLGPYWGIAIKNNSGQTVSTTAGDHVLNYNTDYPEIQ